MHRAEMGIAGLGTVETLMAFYARSGIRFIEPNESEGWGVSASFLTLPYEQERQD
ncbi:hypothetical protein HFO05_19510 [Rhizobium laguerreae]|uniref:hypothetical protein n=1 Tax=Rhizobium laguerreae TaxID=1076926 RepID=UPI001C921B69|nr:hypothetical protein [Rhizobium laguerreae]MBY3270765.1 hypothetical protein [Rhizobium laguerreae]